jgi:tetratricopeptide (TPR) repeat protein
MHHSLKMNVIRPEGVLYFAFGQYRESLNMFRRALQINNEMAEAWYNVGALYDMCEQSKDAQLAYEKAAECGFQDKFVRIGEDLNPVSQQLFANSETETRDVAIIGDAISSGFHQNDYNQMIYKADDYNISDDDEDISIES